MGGGGGLYVNSIVANHMTGISLMGSATVDYVLWHNNLMNTSDMGLTLSNEFTGDPAFAWDSYHLTSGSAALNIALNAGVTNDMDGQSRPSYTGFDLGADEWAPGAPEHIVPLGTAEEDFSIHWTPDPGADGYRLYRFVDPYLDNVRLKTR
jgi:hypothetical protein